MLHVQQAEVKDKFIQARLFNRVLHHNDNITITTASISINNFEQCTVASKLSPLIIQHPSIESGQRNSLFGNKVAKIFQNSTSAST